MKLIVTRRSDAVQECWAIWWSEQDLHAMGQWASCTIQNPRGPSRSHHVWMKPPERSRLKLSREVPN